jgi:hypothetical protein
MKEEYSQEHINEMRKRLYERGANFNTADRHALTDTKIDVSRNWGGQEIPEKNTTDLRNSLQADTSADVIIEPAKESKTNRRYRSIILLGSFIIFLVITLASSAYIYLGGNQISSDNIQLTVSGPSLLGGGEVISLQVGITNNNSVPIESATLILKYPSGTRSVGDSPRNLFEERIMLDDIAPGDTQSIPVRVAIFGEENSEKEITGTLEYRIGGSNGTFYKDSEPLAFRISSSPLVLSIDSVKKVASGQLVDVTITAASNASSPLTDMLITAEYPNGFDYQSASQEPVYGENVWRIDDLLPEEKESITIRGVIGGLTEESLQINFVAGPADPDNQYAISSPLADTRAEFTIERPFIDVAIAIEDQTSGVVIIPQDETANVKIDIINTLDESVYDMVVEVVPRGNALDENSIKGNSGFFDSNTNSVRWEVANNPSFSTVNPGSKRSLNFTITQGDTKTTSAFDLLINVYARRVAESSAAEQLIGTVTREGKYSSSVALGSQVGRNVGRFGDAGPIPPEVEEVTTYTVTLVAEAGANDMVDAKVNTSLPVYVDWLDEYDAEGQIIYNPVSKKLEWNVGDITSGQRKELIFQVSIQPSSSQFQSSPVLVNQQRIQANDRFTSELLQDTAPPVTTELSTEAGFEEDNGVVIR